MVLDVVVVVVVGDGDGGCWYLAGGEVLESDLGRAEVGRESERVNKSSRRTVGKSSCHFSDNRDHQDEASQWIRGPANIHLLLSALFTK